MDTSVYDIMVAGHVCLDITPQFKQQAMVPIAELLRPGRLVKVDDAVVSTGGAVSNTGINIKTMGQRVCFAARVGNDLFGTIIYDRFSAIGNSSAIKKVEGISSSYSVVLAPPGVDRIFLHNPGSNDTFCAADLDAAVIAQCRHFHFGYPPLMRALYVNGGRELERIFRIAKDSGATTSCDMALPDPSSEAGAVDWNEILARVLPYVDIYLPSVEEALYMIDKKRFTAMKTEFNGADLIDHMAPDLFTELSDKLLALGTKIATLKAGVRGFYVRTGDKNLFNGMGRARPGDSVAWSNRELWCPAFAVDHVVSATGSGDSSIAGFLSAFLNGVDPELALKYAVCSGWQNVQVIDATSGIKSWSETTAQIKSGMPVINNNVHGNGWRFIDKEQLYAGPMDSIFSAP